MDKDENLAVTRDRDIALRILDTPPTRSIDIDRHRLPGVVFRDEAGDHIGRCGTRAG
ncbi:hypothetical protein [Sphingomonas sp. RT2P30]|uniref:hypothetical protein n=1 Tax=Parasphingomonas halimpatiens TaxID=3096162 RepID=UPI002FC789A0